MSVSSLAMKTCHIGCLSDRITLVKRWPVQQNVGPGHVIYFTILTILQIQSLLANEQRALRLILATNVLHIPLCVCAIY